MNSISKAARLVRKKLVEILDILNDTKVAPNDELLAWKIHIRHNTTILKRLTDQVLQEE
jgi:hypothetical protein